MEKIQDRVEDARLLWRHNRRVGALLVALVAVAARSRVDHPWPARDRDAFEQLIRSRFSIDFSVEYRGGLWAWGAVLCEWMRCQLVHEGQLPTDLRFMDDADLVRW